MKNRLYFLTIIVSLLSCTLSAQDHYYHKVKNNLNKFYTVLDYINKNNLFNVKDNKMRKNSSFYISDNICLYENEIKDIKVLKILKTFRIDRICLEKRNDEWYNNVIVFHKSYNPLFGSSKTIEYDFGESPLRNSLKKDNEKDFSIIMDSNFIYSIDKNPAFKE